MGAYSEIGRGWYPLVDKLLEDVLAIAPKTEFTQIKEKFGTLRVYASTEGSDEVWALIKKAEAESAKICEECGKPGEHKEEAGWYRTRCKEHEGVIV